MKFYLDTGEMFQKNLVVWKPESHWWDRSKYRCTPYLLPGRYFLAVKRLSNNYLNYIRIAFAHIKSDKIGQSWLLPPDISEFGIQSRELLATGEKAC